jgi:hypothetical protein
VVGLRASADDDPAATDAEVPIAMQGEWFAISTTKALDAGLTVLEESPRGY